MSVTAILRKVETEVPLNSLGYPLRPNGDADVCRYFTETGYCKYAGSCKHHHPEEYCTKRIEKQRARQEREKNANYTATKQDTTTSGEEKTKKQGPRQQSGPRADKPAVAKGTIPAGDTHEDSDDEWTPVTRAKGSKKVNGEVPVTNPTTIAGPTKTTSKFMGYNSRGFPLREGAEECQFYVNTLGLCRHGQGCRFTHPEWICEFAQEKPRATMLSQHHTNKPGITTKAPEIPKDPVAMRDEMQRQLREMGLPYNACYYYFVLDNCRNLNCPWKHVLDVDGVEDSEKEARSDEEREVNKVVKEIPKQSPFKQQDASQKSLIEQQADTIVSKLSLAPNLAPALVDAAKGCGAKESLTEIATSILSQALLLKKVTGEEMRAICKEVAILRANKAA